MSGSRVGIIGIPYDEKSSFLRGTSKGPDKIREVLNDGSSNFESELGFEIKEGIHIQDYGNIQVSNYLEDIQQGIRTALQTEQKLITLGGDHSIAYPVIKVFYDFYPNLHVLQLDAHADLYEEFEGDPHSHACPFARVMEQNLAQSLTQVGIRVISKHQNEQKERFGVDIITMRDWYDGVRPQLKGPLYISLDLDVFDPGFAPGISHYEPGGLSPREVIELILDIDVPIIGADIVEYNPERDHHGMTAMLAAKLLKELAGKMYAN